MYFRNRKQDVYYCLIIEFCLRGCLRELLAHACMSMVFMSSMIRHQLRLNYILQIVPIIANDTIDSTNDVNGCQKTVQGYVVTFDAVG